MVNLKLLGAAQRQTWEMGIRDGENEEKYRISRQEGEEWSCLTLSAFHVLLFYVTAYGLTLLFLSSSLTLLCGAVCVTYTTAVLLHCPLQPSPPHAWENHAAACVHPAQWGWDWDQFRHWESPTHKSLLPAWGINSRVGHGALLPSGTSVGKK